MSTIKFQFYYHLNLLPVYTYWTCGKVTWEEGTTPYSADTYTKASADTYIRNGTWVVIQKEEGNV